MNPSLKQEKNIYLKNVGRKIQCNHSVWIYSLDYGFLRESMSVQAWKIRGTVKEALLPRKVTEYIEDVYLLADNLLLTRRAIGSDWQASLETE